MSKYIKTLKYTDSATSTTYNVDTRAIKDADNANQTLKQKLDLKADTSGTYTNLNVGYATTAGNAASAVNATTAGDADTLDGKHASEFQNALPTTSTAGKVLTSTNTAGTVEWSDAASGGSIDNIKAGGSDLPIVDKRVEIDKVLTSAQYAALSTAEKNNGMCYFITDEDSLDDKIVQVTGTSTVSAMSQNAVTSALNGKQPALPTTSISGKVLKSTSTAGTVEWGDASSSAVSWGTITGTLSNQTDLQSALNGKASNSHTHVISDVANLQSILNGKQDTLTAGTGITISGGTISVSYGNAESEEY